MKTKRVRVVDNNERQCNFRLFREVQRVNCPPNTVKQVENETGPHYSQNPQCQQRVTGKGKKRKIDYIGEAIVRCIRNPCSAS